MKYWQRQYREVEKGHHILAVDSPDSIREADLPVAMGIRRKCVDLDRCLKV